MLIVGSVLVSEDLLESEFACRLDACKGACCIEGDSGAPLNPDEVREIRNNLPAIMPYLNEEHREFIRENGFSEKDSDGDEVTQCLGGRACCFVTYENGMAFCGIEKAWLDGKSTFHKPISCHLYPIREVQLPEYTALNYHRWDICKPGCSNGKALGVPLYSFLKAPLVRRFGSEWYAMLEEIAIAWKNKDA